MSEKKNYYHGLNHWKEVSMAKLKKREDGRYQKVLLSERNRMANTSKKASMEKRKRNWKQTSMR